MVRILTSVVTAPRRVDVLFVTTTWKRNTTARISSSTPFSPRCTTLSASYYCPPPDVQSDDLLYSVSSGLFLGNVITLIPRLLLHVSIYHVSIYLRAHGTGMMWNPHCIDLLEPSTPNDYEEEVTVVTHEYTIYNRCTAAQLHTYIVKQCLM